MPSDKKKNGNSAPNSGWFMGGSNPKNREARKAAGMETKKDKKASGKKKKKRKR